jgi:hypothetical protein
VVGVVQPDADDGARPPDGSADPLPGDVDLAQPLRFECLPDHGQAVAGQDRAVDPGGHGADVVRPVVCIQDHRSLGSAGADTH